MSTHHCCEPTHRDYDARMRRLRDRMQEAESRATWAETNETVMARTVERLRDRLEALGEDPDD